MDKKIKLEISEEKLINLAKKLPTSDSITVIRVFREFIELLETTYSEPEPETTDSEPKLL